MGWVHIITKLLIRKRECGENLSQRDRGLEDAMHLSLEMEEAITSLGMQVGSKVGKCKETSFSTVSRNPVCQLT